ncbi:MAG: TylF/MycF/NovP-related O-methyltransferase [Myxococcota bacterium]
MTSSSYLPELPAIPNRLERGRRVHEGYQRGAGLQFGGLARRIESDPVYRRAMKAAGGRSILGDDNRYNLFLILRFFLARVPHGNIVEFGCYKGGNAIFMASVARELHPNVRILALDTFEGMPETDKHRDAHDRGDFADVDLASLEAHVARLGLSNLKFRKGLFQDTAKPALEDLGSVALAHIDCDIYSAVAYSYEVVRPAMVPGGYLVFDDATVSTCIGATEAVEELVIRRDGLSAEQIYPHFVFRAPGAA